MTMKPINIINSGIILEVVDRLKNWLLVLLQDFGNLPYNNVIGTLEYWYISLPDIIPSIDILP